MNLADAFRANYQNAADADLEFTEGFTTPRREGIDLRLWRLLPDSETAHRAPVVVPAPAFTVTEPYTTTDAQGHEVHVPEGARVEAGNYFLTERPEMWKPAP